MARLVGTKLADQAVAQQIEVTDGIQHLVLDEFVLITKAILVQDTKLSPDNGIIAAATPG